MLDEKRNEYFSQVQPGNLWLSTGQRNRMARFYQPQFTKVLADHHIVESNVAMFPLAIDPQAQQEIRQDGPRPNVSSGASDYLKKVSAEPTTLFHHLLACLHAAQYSEDNADALRQDWPRIPLPATRQNLVKSAGFGESIAALLNSEDEVNRVTSGAIRPELKVIGNIAAAEGGTLNPARDLLIDAGWGHGGKEGITMPGKGRLVERDYTAAERDAITQGTAVLGLTTEQAFVSTRK